MNRNLPWLLVLALLIALYAMRGIADTRGDRLTVADSLATWHMARADSLARENAEQAEEIAVIDQAYAEATIRWATERRNADARIREATARASEATETLRASLDSVGVRLLAEIEAGHASEVAELRAIIVGQDDRIAQAENRVAERDVLLFGKDREIADLRASNAQLSIAANIAYSMLRSEKRRGLAWKGVTVVAVACVLLCDKVTG